MQLQKLVNMFEGLLLAATGIQPADDKTLHRINRGHDFACYPKTTRHARKRGLKVCTSLIVGLPDEEQAHCMATLENGRGRH